MEQLSRAALVANLEYSKNMLKQNIEHGEIIRKQVEKDEQALKAATPNEIRDRFQAVFDEENFLDAVWYLQDEPELQIAASNFHVWKKMLEDRLTELGVKFQ